MTRADIEIQLCDAIRGVQTASGRACPPLSGATVPIGGVDGFDSLNGIEVGVEVGAVLGDVVGENPLVNPDTGRASSIREAADRILKQMNKAGGARS